MAPRCVIWLHKPIEVSLEGFWSASPKFWSLFRPQNMVPTSNGSETRLMFRPQCLSEVDRVPWLMARLDCMATDNRVAVFARTESRNHIEGFAPDSINSRQGVRERALITRALVTTLAIRLTHVGSNKPRDIRQGFLRKICRKKREYHDRTAYLELLGTSWQYLLSIFVEQGKIPQPS